MYVVDMSISCCDELKSRLNLACHHQFQSNTCDRKFQVGERHLDLFNVRIGCVFT
jgi:hypothetical protein